MIKHLRACTLSLGLALALTLGLPLPLVGLPGMTPVAEAQSARFSPGQAAALVQKQVGGKILKVDTLERGGRVLYRVKVLQEDGRIRTLNVDGQSGKILKQRS